MTGWEPLEGGLLWAEEDLDPTLRVPEDLLDLLPTVSSQTAGDATPVEESGGGTAGIQGGGVVVGEAPQKEERGEEPLEEDRTRRCGPLWAA